MKNLMICLLIVSSFLGCASKNDDSGQVNSALNGTWSLEGYNSNNTTITIDSKYRFVLTDDNGLIQSGTLYSIDEKGKIQPGYFANGYLGSIALKFDSGSSEKFVYEINSNQSGNRYLLFRRY